MHDLLLIILAFNGGSKYNRKMKVKSAEKLFKGMKEGLVYRRHELSKFTSAVDRDVKELLHQGLVKKAAPGLYYRARQSRFGDLPPVQHELVRAFLKTDDFLLTSLNVYNGLGLGLTDRKSTRLNSSH